MAKLTKADAARQLGISRTTLYKLIHTGKVSTAPDETIDTAELVRAVSTLHVHTRQPVQSALDTQLGSDVHRERPESGHLKRQFTQDTERQLTSTEHAVVDILREQMQAMREELQAARAERQAAQEERQAAREERALLLRMLEQVHQQSQRLLEAPRSTPTPAPPLITTSNISATRGETARGDMRRRIVALLDDYPEGLTPAEIRILLRVGKRLSNTCIAMLRDGLLRRVGPGKYTAREE